MDISLTGSCYFGEQRLFDELHLDIGSGEWTCLLGASGVGKSTVLRLLAGLETGAQFKGKILFDGDLEQQPIAYMAQSDLLLPWLSVLDNVLLGARLRKENPDQDKASDLIQKAGLSGHASKKPHQLSGGMRQRVALVRTLMENTDVVLLDEPFTALDTRTRHEMQELSFNMLQGKTVLLVTHDPAEAVRLGNGLFILTEQGARRYELPVSQPIREVDDPLLMNAQAKLLVSLREGQHG